MCEAHPRGAVIVCGGGVVETPAARLFLSRPHVRDLMMVVEISREVADIEADLTRNAMSAGNHRPSFPEPLRYISLQNNIQEFC